MLEVGNMDIFDQAYQRGAEIGRADVYFWELIDMVKYVKVVISEDSWKRFQTSEEKKHKKYVEEHPDRKEACSQSYDSEGHLIKEKWIEEQKDKMQFLGFPEEAWEELRGFIEKYPGVSEENLARRVLRESEYKYTSLQLLKFPKPDKM